MTLNNILSIIPNCDEIDVQDSNGSFYSGLRKDFNMNETLDYIVDGIRAYKNTTIILCNH